MSRRLSNPYSSDGRHFWNVPNSGKEYDTVADLAPYKPLLFRISHRNSSSFYFKGEGVLASEHYTFDTETGERRMIQTIDEICTRPSGLSPIITDKLVGHVRYSKTEQTNFVSTTFSFTWALFFSEMNATNWKEEDVELLVIDTAVVARRAWVAHEKLSRICPDWYSNPDHRKIANAAYSSQEVIVVDCIPESAIISRVPWAELKTQLPSWFYFDSGRTNTRQLVPTPKDEQWQRYLRWQRMAQGRLHQLSAVSLVRWEIVSRQEVVAFILAVLSFKGVVVKRLYCQTARGLYETLKRWSNLPLVVFWSGHEDSVRHL